MRYQEENNVRYFDLHVHGLHSVPIRLERNSGLCVCVLEVPGLAKSRPSVLKGDHLYTKESGVIAAVEYEGMVLFVGERTVSHPSWITPPSSLDGLFVPVHYVTL